MFKFIKKIKTVFIVFLFIMFFIFLFSQGQIYKKEDLEYGLTFSKKQATELGFNYQDAFKAVLDDLKVKKLRLPAYWDEVEPERGVFQWEDLDWQINEASAAGADIILSIGSRLPRWPECHIPGWADDLSKNQKDSEILDYITNTISRYKDNVQIIAWQVENEPFLSHFGDCPQLDKNFLDQEIALARNLDSRPIVITDSGELSIWIPAARRANIFGTTMYRDTYSQWLKRYIHYPIKPGFFRFKKNITRLFTRPDKWIVIELQAEPWGPVPYQNLTREERDKTMNLEKFKEILEFSRQAGFSEFYLWGAEWWYWEKETQNNPALRNEAKNLFKN